MHQHREPHRVLLVHGAVVIPDGIWQRTPDREATAAASAAQLDLLSETRERADPFAERGERRTQVRTLFRRTVGAQLLHALSEVVLEAGKVADRTRHLRSRR